MRHQLVRDAEDHDEEDEGRDRLEDEGRHDIIFAEIAGTPAIGAEPAGPARCLAGHDQIEHERADDRAEDLSDHIGDEVTGRHAARDQRAEADGRIDVAAGDRADRIGHCDDGEAERESNAEDADSRRAGNGRSCDDCGAAAEEYERECTDELGESLLHFLNPLKCDSPPGRE